MTNTVTIEALNESMRGLIQALSHLLALLREEQEVLRKPEPENLDVLHQKKVEALTQVNKLEQDLIRVLATTAKELPDTLKQYVSQHPLLASSWEQLQQAIAQCKSQNQVNGQIIQVNLTRNKRLIDLVFAVSKDDASQTYDVRGRTN
jgi:flagellar biosynthesis/type III secretory pathway chaperone